MNEAKNQSDCWTEFPFVQTVSERRQKGSLTAPSCHSAMHLSLLLSNTPSW
jgi:hypothetical protein